MNQEEMPSSPSISNGSLDDDALISVTEEVERSQSKFGPTGSQPTGDEDRAEIPLSTSFSDDSLDDVLLISVADEVERSQSPTKPHQTSSQLSTVDGPIPRNQGALTPPPDVSSSLAQPQSPSDEPAGPNSKPTLPWIESIFQDDADQYGVKANGSPASGTDINGRIPAMILEPRHVELPPLLNHKGKRRLIEEHLTEVVPSVKRPSINQIHPFEPMRLHQPFNLPDFSGAGSSNLVPLADCTNFVNDGTIDPLHTSNAHSVKPVAPFPGPHSKATSQPISAEEILEDFSKRIRNTIFRLNKSLGELSSDDQAQKFTLRAVEEHAQLLVKEHFYNPRAGFDSPETNNVDFMEGCTYDGDGNIVAEGDETPLGEESHGSPYGQGEHSEDYCGMKLGDWGWVPTYYF